MTDPFDHSHCHHPRPRYVLDISNELKVDFFEWLHHLWKLAVNQDVIHIVQMVEQMNEYMALSVLGEREQIDDEIRDRRTTEREIRILRDDAQFNDELRKLFEDDQRGTDGHTSDGGSEHKDEGTPPEAE
jgi:hypothetical protein